MSPRTSPRVRVERNIYRDGSGLSAVVQVGTVQREKRFPPETPLRIVRQWVGRTRGELADKQPKSKRGTLERDAERYYKRIAHLASWRERRSEIRAWVARYGKWPRAKISHPQIMEARQAWRAKGVKPKTINHRVAALRHLYRELDGRRASTPCDEIVPLSVPREPIVPVPAETIRAVYLKLLEHEHEGLLRDAATRARFMVIAASGVRASELMRAEPGDIDLEARVWRTRDGKGGVRPGGLYLHDDLLEAWKVFVKAAAWGYFETSSFARVVRNCGWPAGVRPYTLRHSVGIALSESGADLADVGAWLGHARSDTTRQHYVPVLAGRMRLLGEALTGRIGWPEPPGSVAPKPGTDGSASGSVG